MSADPQSPVAGAPAGHPSRSVPVPAFTLRTLLRIASTDAPLKAFGTTVGMTGFFILYFAVLRHPLFPVTILPETWLDHAIGFHPWTLLPYASLWIYISLVPAFIPDRRQLLGFAGGCLFLAAVGLTLFTLWPSAVPPPSIDWTLHPAFVFLKQADAAGNACPSLHAAFAVFSALWFTRLLPGLGASRLVQILSLLWAALIVFSTLGTKQHVALDALCGAILGAWVASLNFVAVPLPPGAPALRRPLFVAVALIKVCAVLLWTCGLPLGFCLVLFLSAGAIILYQLFTPHAGELVRVHTRFTPSAPEAREVWLTIDDGPDPDDSPRILDLLDRNQARATFFLIGERAARHPDLVADILRRGHEVAHHTHTHPVATFWCASPARVRRELDAALDAFASATSADTPPPRRFRAPVGIKNLFLAPALAARGLECIGWTIRSGDTFARTPATVAARIAERLRPGAIILLHEGPPLRREVRVAALARVLETLHAQNYRAVIPDRSRLL